MAVINIVIIILVYLLMLGVGITLSVLCGIAIYRDAKALGRDDGTLFGVLTGLFGAIPAAVYLGIRGRRKGVGVCPGCSAQYLGIDLGKPLAPMCAHCGQPLALYQSAPTDEELAAGEKSRKINKTLFVFGIIYNLLLPVLFFVFFYGYFMFISSMMMY